MKRLLLIPLATAALAAGTAQAENFNVYGNGHYGMAGCGLGSLIFGDKPGPVQIVAATFNATSGSQTFGITTGTSNCGKGLIKAEQMSFIDGNLASLKKESAQGHGDTVVAYATMLGCRPQAFRDFEATMQARHGSVFAANDPAAVLDGTRAAVDGSPALKDACTKI